MKNNFLLKCFAGLDFKDKRGCSSDRAVCGLQCQWWRGRALNKGYEEVIKEENSNREVSWEWAAVAHSVLDGSCPKEALGRV